MELSGSFVLVSVELIHMVYVDDNERVWCVQVRCVSIE